MSESDIEDTLNRQMRSSCLYIISMNSLRNMKLEYLRIDDFRLISLGVSGATWVWLNQLKDVEYRRDYCSHFVLKGSPSHTAIVMKLGDIFE